MVEVYSDRACVVHAHVQRQGSKTDKPAGTPIKCYSFQEEGGREQAIKKAYAMHTAIMESEMRRES